MRVQTWSSMVVAAMRSRRERARNQLHRSMIMLSRCQPKSTPWSVGNELVVLLPPMLVFIAATRTPESLAPAGLEFNRTLSDARELEFDLELPARSAPEYTDSKDRSRYKDRFKVTSFIRRAAYSL